MKLIVLAALVACAMGAKLPLKVPAPSWDPNEERIVGGVIVEPHSLPFQVRMESSIGALRCGGSIYNEWTILTAAHCVDDLTSPSQIRIVAGDHQAGVNNDGTEQVRDVEAFVFSSSYIASTFENDVAVLHLAQPLDLTVREAKAIKLPDASLAKTDVPEGTNVTISGWGTTSSGGTISTVLRAVSAPVVSDANCGTSYPNQIKASMLCAGLPEGGVDSCQGDSGGPLFTCTDDTKTDCTQWGIVSWGRGCALEGYPGVYTETTYYLDWIKNNAKVSA